MGVLIAGAIGVGLLFLLVWTGSRAAITLAVLEVTDGKLTVTRGALSPRVVGDLRDIVARPKVKSATLRIVRSKEWARVEVHGAVDPKTVQRIRNVVGNVPVAQLVKKDRT